MRTHTEHIIPVRFSSCVVHFSIWYGSELYWFSDVVVRSRDHVDVHHTTWYVSEENVQDINDKGVRVFGVYKETEYTVVRRCH